MDYLELKHHGVQGQKWGIRRYQNPDGSLTDEGRKKVAQYESKQKKIAEQRSKRLRNQEKIDSSKTKASLGYVGTVASGLGAMGTAAASVAVAPYILGASAAAFATYTGYQTARYYGNNIVNSYRSMKLDHMISKRETKLYNRLTNNG